MLSSTTGSELFQSLNDKGEVIDVSQAWLDFSGYTQKEVVGKHFTNFLSKDSYQIMKRNLPKLKEYGKLRNINFSFQHKDGSFSDVILDGSATYDLNGGFIHTHCQLKTLKHILESKEEIQHILEETNAINEELLRTQKELLQEKALFSMAQEVAGMGYWTIDAHTQEVFWSDEIYHICGLNERTVTPSYKTYLKVVHPQDKALVNKAFSQARLNNIAFDISHRCVLPDGSIIYTREQGKNIKDSKGKNIALMGTFLNITESVLIQQQLTSEKQKAELAAKSKSSFLANMSHEIRTPMNAILGFVDILSKQETQASKIEQFDIVKSSGHALLHIINDILDFSKIQSAKLHIESIAFNPQESLKNAIMLYTQLAKDKRINFNYTISSELPKNCLGDEIRLKQIMSNLISNALKFTPENGYIQVNINYIEGRIYISVEDSGVGIQADKLDKIFNMFEQEDNSITRNFGGTGLGLAISKELVEMMGGELLVRSQVGYGSHFNFNIILEEIAETLEVKDDKEHYTSTMEGRVLLVEDNKSNQLLMSIFLEELGLEFDIASDGQEAVDMVKSFAYKNKHYEAILMDENMPNMNGTQASKEIRHFEKNLPYQSIIIAVTANALSSDKARFLEAGMDDYLSKPIDQDQLEKVLRKYI